MHRYGLVHVVGWTEPSVRIRPMPIYMAGHGESVPMPLNSKGKVTRVHTVFAAPKPILMLVSFSSMIKTLMAGPASSRVIAEETGVHWENVRRSIRLMHKLGIIYIGAWERREIGGGSPTALWAFGLDRSDVPRPKRMTKSERAALARERSKARTRRKQMVRMIKVTASAANDGNREAA
jgi:hypothetical protein